MPDSCILAPLARLRKSAYMEEEPLPNNKDIDVPPALVERIGLQYARQRLAVERDHEAQVFGYGLNFFHPENWYSLHDLLTAGLRVSGLYERGRRNAHEVRLRRNVFSSHTLPAVFDGYSLLHLSDLHADTSGGAMSRASELISGLRYDLCVWTGDYRGRTAGDFLSSIRALAKLRDKIRTDIFAVLGNHDSVLMVPHLENMGIRMLMNESTEIDRGGARIYLAGIDDAHFFRADNIEKATQSLPARCFKMLLSHTPETYKQAARAGFSVMLSGHTHGGQICLPYGIPLTLDAVLPRAMGAGAWSWGEMQGYTSVGVGTSIVPVRFNCPPEITLHELRCLNA